MERLQTTNNRNTGNQIPDEKREAIIADLQEGLGVVACAKKHETSTHAVTALKNKLEDEAEGFNLVSWKKSTAATLSHFVSKGSERLVREIDDMPLASLPIAIAVAIDKIQALHDQPQTVVEHRLRIDQGSLNELLRSEGIVVEGEFTETIESQ
jgi:hypothetical protein